jgi:hypothetical protein
MRHEDGSERERHCEHERDSKAARPASRRICCFHVNHTMVWEPCAGPEGIEARNPETSGARIQIVGSCRDADAAAD